MLRAFWHTWTRRLHRPPAAARRGTPPRRRSFQPGLLILEDRVVPSNLTVTSLADSGPGSLRAAVAAAGDGDTIQFAPALSGGTIRLSTGQLNIAQSVTIQGPGQALLAISAQDRSRIFHVLGGFSVSISGLTLSNGYARVIPGDAGFGGAILDDGTLTLNDTAFINNTSAAGGGAIDAFGSPTDTLSISNSTFTGNRAVAGFGGGIGTTDLLTVTNTTFTDNTAPSGGGAIDYVIFSTAVGPTFVLTVSNCTFTGNSGANGGAIYANDSPMTGTALTIAITGSTFTNNFSTGPLTDTADSGFGGAIDTFVRPGGTATASVSLTGDTFQSNQGNYGAGIDTTIRASSDFTGSATYTVTGTTASGNQGVRGGGLYNEIDNLGSGSITVTVDSSTFNDNGTQSFKTSATPTARLISGDGAGVFNTIASLGGSPVTLRYTNDTIANNSAEISGTDPALTALGGGLYLEVTVPGSNPAVSLDSLTVAYNDAATDGGGVATATFSGLMLRNTVVADNTVGTAGANPDVAGAVTSLGNNLIGNTADFSSWVPTDLVNVDPRLSVLNNNGGPTQTIALLADSPAINTGATSLVLDQLGNSRGSPTDIGAVQYAATVADHFLVLAPPTANVGVPFDITVVAVDQFGNVVDNYAGTVTFSILTGDGTVPPEYTFNPSDHGSHTFVQGVTLTDSGVQIISVTDTATGITGFTFVIVF
jgi:predicted outer membrane repeat protein